MRNPFRRRALAERAGRVSLAAAGHRIDVSARAEIRALQKRRQKWQDDGWLFYDEIGEIKYAHNFIGNAFARVRLYVAELPDPEEEPLATSDAQAIDALERLADPVVGHGELMRAGAINWQTVGECYLVGVAKPDGTEVWDIRSIDDVEVARDGRGWSVEDPETGQPLRITENDFIARLWRPHARKRRLADSPLRGVLPICEELILVEKAARAALKSRGGGRLMFIPSDMSFGPTDPTLAEAGERDEFDDEFLEALITPIQNPDSAEAVVPVIIRGDAEKGKEIRVIDLDRPLDTFLDTRTERALKRLGHGLNLPPEIIEGVSQSNHWCVDEETEILTRDRGWVRHDALREGELVRTLDHVTGLAEWQPVQHIYRAKVTRLPMRALHSRTHHSLTTMEHRWPVLHTRYDNGEPSETREWKTSKELGSYDLIISGASSADLPAVAKYADDIVELVAWFWTEGSVRQQRICIAQSHTVNSDRVDRIRGCLTRVFGPADPARQRPGAPPAWREVIQSNLSSFGGPITVFHLNAAASACLNEVAPSKRPTREFVCSLTLAQLELFIDVSCQGDGHHYRTGTLDIWQREADALDAFELALILSGRSVSRYMADGGTAVRANQATRVRPIKAAYEAERMGRDGATDEIVAYTGTIWCPTTPTHTWLARRDGRVFYTGNSAWLVDDSTFRNHIQGDLEDFLGSMTRAYLWPELVARGVADPQRFFIWYDPSKLIAQPNKGKDADFGVEHLLLSSDAWRQVKGFSEDDAPDQEEIIKRLGVMFGTLDPAQTAAILNRLAGAEVIPTESVEVTTEPDEPEETPSPTTRGPPVSSEPGAPIAASIVAAAGRPLGARLSSIDQQFRDRLEGALDTAMRRALDRAGSKIRSRAQRDRSTRASIGNTELDLIAATIGPDAVARLGLEENDLIEGTFEQYESRFLTWAASTQRQALAVARAATEFEDEEAADLESRQASDRSDAWAWLSAALTSLALTRLYNPRPDSGGEGEVDPDATVPYSLVREALARAGGERAIRVIGDAAVSSLGGPLGGIGTGRLILDVLRERGQPVEAWEWEYGTYPRQTFEPHLALDGFVFERFDDARLRNRNAWPRVEFYAPGDHANCKCDAVPVIVDARLAEPLVASSNGKVVVHA